MPIKIKEADKILKNYENEFNQSGLFYTYTRSSANPGKGGDGNYMAVLIWSDPLPIGEGGIDKYIARRIAKKYDIVLRHWDFGRGEDETDLKPVFYAYCSEKSQIKSAIEKIKQAREDLEQKLNKLADLVFDE